MITRDKSGKMHEAVSATHKVSKREVFREEKDEDLIVQGDEEDGKVLGAVRLVDSLKLSYKFQSIGIDVGVDLPCWIDPSNPGPDVNKALDRAEELIDTRLEQKAAGLRDLLKMLASQEG